MPRRSEYLRGSQWLARGQDVVAERIDRDRLPPGVEDLCDEPGARKLARRIEEYWGGKVRCFVWRDIGVGVYCVGSDLRFAAPPGVTKRQTAV